MSMNFRIPARWGKAPSSPPRCANLAVHAPAGRGEVASSLDPTAWEVLAAEVRPRAAVGVRLTPISSHGLTGPWYQPIADVKDVSLVRYCRPRVPAPASRRQKP